MQEQTKTNCIFFWNSSNQRWGLQVAFCPSFLPLACFIPPSTLFHLNITCALGRLADDGCVVIVPPVFFHIFSSAQHLQHELNNRRRGNVETAPHRNRNHWCLRDLHLWRKTDIQCVLQYTQSSTPALWYWNSKNIFFIISWRKTTSLSGNLHVYIYAVFY